jgi:citrate synthase
MGILKDKFKAKADASAAEIRAMLKEHGNKKIGEVTLAQIYQGMRGMTGLVSETSLLDAHEGIRFRGYSIPELRAQLPKVEGGTEPMPEALFHLMMIGEMPTQEDAIHITNVWQRKSHVPQHVFKTIDALPVTTHPMTMFVTGVMALQTESIFAASFTPW